MTGSRFCVDCSIRRKKKGLDEVEIERLWQHIGAMDWSKREAKEDLRHPNQVRKTEVQEHAFVCLHS